MLLSRTSRPARHNARANWVIVVPRQHCSRSKHTRTSDLERVPASTCSPTTVSSISTHSDIIQPADVRFQCTQSNKFLSVLGVAESQQAHQTMDVLTSSPVRESCTISAESAGTNLEPVSSEIATQQESETYQNLNAEESQHVPPPHAQPGLSLNVKPDRQTADVEQQLEQQPPQQQQQQQQQQPAVHQPASSNQHRHQHHHHHDHHHNHNTHQHQQQQQQQQAEEVLTPLAHTSASDQLPTHPQEDSSQAADQTGQESKPSPADHQPSEPNPEHQDAGNESESTSESSSSSSSEDEEEDEEYESDEEVSEGTGVAFTLLQQQVLAMAQGVGGLGLGLGGMHVSGVSAVLGTCDLQGVADMIQEGRAKRIVFMTGAGISVSAGIPDFRTPGTGLYSQLAKYNLPYPEAVFDIKYFKKVSAKPFFQLAKELFPGNYLPTAAHYFIRLVSLKGMLKCCFTQNIDSLETIAGVPQEEVVAAHGNFDSAHCTDCQLEHSTEYVRTAVMADELCRCTRCRGLVKPDIVFFGEQLPDRYHARVETDFPCCDLLIVMGTSLAVQPFASLIHKVPLGVPRLLINREAVGLNRRSSYGQGPSPGFKFSHPKNMTDVLQLGDCDQGVMLLAELLGWGDELRALMEAGPQNLA